ncbi:MAG: hypothetical protein IBX55_00435 [Methyloprofundus sp.]|nr:hypothetical protein [Methyloprofundus sp.]
MPTSLILDGQVLDWHFKKNGLDGFIHNFYTGDLFQGQIFDMGKSWSASPGSNTPAERRMLLDGFRTRADASRYILEARYHHAKKLEEYRLSREGVQASLKDSIKSE